MAFSWSKPPVVLVGAGCLLVASPAWGQSSAELAAEIRALRGELAEQRSLIERQRTTVVAQQQAIDQLEARLEYNLTLSDLDSVRGGGLGQGLPTSPSPNLPPLPDRPVGEAPPENETPARAEVRAVPEGQGVLTPAGRFVLDPQIEYVRSSTNRLVFRGIELIPGIQIGLIEATDADRDTVIGTLAGRYGITSRLEVEVRVPYLYRRDRIEVVQQRDEGIVRSIQLEGDDIGDIEFGARYQINRARPLHPIWIASLRVKSNTGRNPFEIPYDEFGVATGLATGSGFWGVQPGVSFLLPSDPVVIYGGVSYLWHIADDIDRVVGDVFIGRVDPGDAISGNLGFGFALNPRFSFSLGYRHTYLVPTETEIGETIQRSNRLQVGSFTFGMSYRVTERQTVNFGFNFGVTEDAPDLGITIRVPFDIDGS